MSTSNVAFESELTVDEAYALLDAQPPQTFVDIGPGLRIKRKKSGVPVVRLHYSAIPERNPLVNPVWSAKPEDRDKYELTPTQWNKENQRSKSSPAGWDREQEIIDEAGGGEKVYASILSTFYNLIVISDPYWMPDPRWKVVGGFDHGLRNPTTLEKAYIDFNGDMYFAGEYYQMRTETWANTISMNVPILSRMPDLYRMDWLRADPSIFDQSIPNEDGAATNVAVIYRKNGFSKLSRFPTSISRENLTLEARLHDHWRNLGDPAKGGRKPSLYIVCRNPSDRLQPGLHPYDSPNLLWELKRIHRKEYTAKQLMTRNQTEEVVDKDDHAVDAMKYVVLSLPRPADVPLVDVFREQTEGLNPMSQAIAAERFLANHKGMALSMDRPGQAQRTLGPQRNMNRARMPR